MTTAIGYVRVSTDQQADSGLSLDDQTRKVRAQSELSDLNLVEILTDAGESASSLDRPAMADLLRRVDGGAVDVIIVAKLDRLTRSVKDLSLLLERLGKAKRADGDGRGVDLISTAESLDTSSATGRLMLNILASVSQWEREVISERTTAALREKRAQGYRAGTVPFGYVANTDGKLSENEPEQAALRAIRELRAEGNSWRAVAAELNEQGFRTRRGGRWIHQGVHQIARTAGLS